MFWNHEPFVSRAISERPESCGNRVGECKGVTADRRTAALSRRRNDLNGQVF